MISGGTISSRSLIAASSEDHFGGFPFRLTTVLTRVVRIPDRLALTTSAALLYDGHIVFEDRRAQT
jgi:hypothetical protein